MDLSSVNWIKVIAPDGGIGYAYTRKHLESIGKNVLDYNGVTVFPLGFRNKNASSPKLGEAIVLIQKGKLTHIVEVLDEVPYQEGEWHFRLVKIIWWQPEIDWVNLPPQSNFLGFDPSLMDGNPNEVRGNKRFKEKWNDLEEFRQHLSKNLESYSFTIGKRFVV